MVLHIPFEMQYLKKKAVYVKRRNEMHVRRQWCKRKKKREIGLKQDERKDIIKKKEHGQGRVVT